MPALRQMGAIYNQKTKESIPIMGLDEIDISREQLWDVQPLGIQSSVAAIWTGSAPVEYQVNFELLAGWGKVKDRGTLMEMCRIFHSLGAHQLSDEGNMAIAPPPVLLVIEQVIDQIGFFKNVRTVMQGPWGPENSIRDFTKALPTVVRFTGTFCFVPGYNEEAAKSGVSVDMNNWNLASEFIRTSFYTLKGIKHG